MAGSTRQAVECERGLSTGERSCIRPAPPARPALPAHMQTEFVTSAVDAAGFPKERLPELALAGRSNVGKSSLINALVRQKVARTSAAPGKTRLANFYRVRREGMPAFHLVDLPGYGYARGGDESRREFAAITGAYFGRRQEVTTGTMGGAARGWRACCCSSTAAIPASRRIGMAWDWLEQQPSRHMVDCDEGGQADAERPRPQRERARTTA